MKQLATSELKKLTLFQEINDEKLWNNMLADSVQKRLIPQYKTIAYIIASIVVLIGGLSLIGWIFDIEILKSFIVGLATMKANTAFAFISAGFAITRLSKRNDEEQLIHKGAFIWAIVTLLIGLLTFAQYTFGWHLGIDELIFADPNTPVALFPGRMSFATALCCILIGASILFLSINQNGLGQILALCTGVVSMLALIGYVFDVSSLYNILIYSSMALHTSVSFLLLTVGALLVQPNHGPMAIVVSNTVGGTMARRLIPVSLVSPFILGSIIFWGQKAGNYSANFAAALFVLSNTIILFGFIFGNACSLYFIDRDRKLIIKALSSAEEKYRGIFENMMEGIYQSSPYGEIVTANPAFAQMLNYRSSAELIANLTDIKHHLFATPDMYDQFMAEFERNGRVQEFETQLQCRDGSTIWVLMNMHIVYDTHEQIHCYEGTVVNISEHKQLEEERTTLEGQLLQSQKIAAVGQLAGGIAHDFNNLLVPIIAYAEMELMRSPDDERLLKHLAQIKKAGERGATLTQQILDFSRQQILEMEVFDLNDVINDFEKMLHRLIREDIELQTILSPSIYHVKADKGKIEQVIMNLVVNACDAMPEGGKLTIETENVYLDEQYANNHIETNVGPHVMLAISDNGMGMDAETQKRIFEPFYTTKNRGEGTGLGLATVHGIVKQHQGNLWLYSELGKGTTFKIYLPQSTDSPVEKVLPTHNPESMYGTETVLVVEDEEMVRKLVCETLESYGYQVIEADSVPHCLQLAADYEGKIDLLLTDVIMPGMNGQELYEKLSQSRSDVKVLYMSGYTDNVIINHSILSDGINFLQKPFTLNKLMLKVKGALE